MKFDIKRYVSQAWATGVLFFYFWRLSQFAPMPQPQVSGLIFSQLICLSLSLSAHSSALLARWLLLGVRDGRVHILMPTAEYVPPGNIFKVCVWKVLRGCRPSCTLLSQALDLHTRLHPGVGLNDAVTMNIYRAQIDEECKMMTQARTLLFAQNSKNKQMFIEQWGSCCSN